ncbi:Rap1-interacting factor 1 N terminal-domain-containing protein [Neohortaea acidophila]|uniref:Rap1-interacting factor 1 N terminal-domain-containing protein n=1 Tax=Neohortaea acidophila TaxID=245834 RepID=A0A6A6Q0N6_9PEZI|nr:Rap1-interacting factor 1 N terminal-domain-containing protein [Neohortaea acidophila]KAF2485591.1 Rap1-interacting factor 1 N terminal-domain-containing protein [Neohortaea acidophila]
MLSVASSPLGRLPQRPPTPPREVAKAVDDAIALLDDSNEVERALNGQSVLKLPREQSDDSPPSSHGSSGSSNTAKKVGFSLTTATIDPDTSRLYPTPGSRGARKSLSSRHSKPIRSILKPSTLPPTPDTTESKRAVYSPDTPGSFSTMMQSIVQQLAAPARSVKLDAYLALNGVLQTYDGVPDAEAMTEHSAAMMQFLTRDMMWRHEEGNLDIQIITQSIKLVCALLFDPKLRETLDDDFRNFITDRALAVLEDPDMPKALVKTHMYLLAMPALRSPNMTPGKIEKVLIALRTIHDTCSGNNVIATRLVIYNRMFDRDPHTMLARTDDWLEHLLHGMLSSIKEVRLRAIETCTRAGMVFGQQPHAAKALDELFEFETVVEDGVTYLDFFKTQLLQMISDKEIGPCVPQIWAAVILFFRSKRLPLEKWTKLKSWTSIIQKCLNSSDIAIRYQAILAWNKMVFVIMPSAATTTPIMAMLKVPITTGLEKKGSDKYSRQVRHYALDSYCNLLHYAFRPGLSHEEIDRAWEVYVEGALSSIDTSTARRGFNLCRVLHGLLNGRTGVWNVNAAPEQVVIHSADLPKLDPRWVRSRLDKVLRVLEPIIAADMWSAAGASEALDVTWYYLMRAIADAGNQEVKTSIELKQALALLVNLFRRLWYGHGNIPQGCERSLWLKKYFARLDTIITAIGPGPCTEEILAAADNDTIEVAPTPSHKPKRQYGPTQSFLGILFAQFYSPPDAMRIDDYFEDAAWAILKRLTSSQPGSITKLALLDNSLKFASCAPKSYQTPLVKERLWTAAARVAMQLLSPETPIAGASESQSAGHGLRHALNVLTAGLSLPSTSATTYDLYSSIFEAARGLAGDAGVVLALVEPFSKALTSNSTTITVPDRVELACEMLTTAPWPRSRQDMDSAHKALWGVSMASLRSPVFDPYNSLYTLTNNLSASLYDGVDTDKRLSAISQSFFTATVDFLDRSPISQLVLALRRTQACLTPWIRDASRKTDMSEEMSGSVCGLWSGIIKLLGKLPNTDTTLLKAIDQLLVAGLTSPHRSIVNSTIIFWNNTFGTQETLEYSVELEKILRARAIDAEITLPSLSDSNIGEAVAVLPEFFESQNEAPATSLPVPQSMGSEKSHLLASPFKPTARNSLVKSPLQKAVGASSPAGHKPRRSVSTTPKARLRHDDSQIQFEHIVDSSPLPQEDESQLLTEHQKEVKARQHQNAQLFPAFSSSPQAQSTALQKNVPKRLDFTAQLQVLPEDSDAQGTPTALPENPESNDDVPSSPTPSSKGNSQTAIEVDVDDNEAEEEIAEDPPSSPPRAEHATVLASTERKEENDNDHGHDIDGSTTEVMDFALANAGVEREQEIGVASVVPGIELHDAQPLEALTELHSDTDLPTIQLQLEEEAASGPLNVDSGAREHSTNEGQAVFDNDEPSQVAIMDEDNEVTRVENSFVIIDSAETPGDSQSTDGSQRSTRKRKRTTSTKFTTKKQRKRESPLKRIASYIWGQSQEEVDEDDEDIGEEIVVASSQRMPSPSPEPAEPAVEALSIPITPMPQFEVEAPDVIVKVEVEEEQPQALVKRGRGRPRKPETPVVSIGETGPEKRLKRKASTLSSSSAASDEQTSSSIVKATPAPSKARKARKDQDAGESRSLRTRKVAAVVINRDEVVDSQFLAETTNVEENNADEGVEDVGEPASASQAETTRAIATPRGILNRMRDALADLGGLILGSQEERQFDDLLFEFRREVHEAGRRGRGT